MHTDLTIHAVVKNEPFIYYAIKSVYDYCDQILLYDTGSIDDTLNDIEILLKEDRDKKIIFRQLQLGFDEEKWTLDNLADFIKQNHGKMSVGRARQMQIDETKTKYFMLVDGDEVHYRPSMIMIQNFLKTFPENIYAVGLPLTWYYDLTHTFTTLTFPYNGRIFVTDKVYMNDESPNEQHVIKESHQIFTYEHPQYLIFDKLKPYAHFESVFRPWRRKNKVPKSNIKSFDGYYPEVMLENSSFLQRWINKNHATS